MVMMKNEEWTATLCGKFLFPRALRCSATDEKWWNQATRVEARREFYNNASVMSFVEFLFVMLNRWRTKEKANENFFLVQQFDMFSHNSMNERRRCWWMMKAFAGYATRSAWALFTIQSDCWDGVETFSLQFDDFNNFETSHASKTSSLTFSWVIIIVHSMLALAVVQANYNQVTWLNSSQKCGFEMISTGKWLELRNVPLLPPSRAQPMPAHGAIWGLLCRAVY